MPATETHQQPKVSGELLATRVYQGLKLDLYGELDDEGYFVTDIALAGSDVSLFGLVSPDVLESLGDWCNANLPSGEQLRRESRDEARVEMAEWIRMAA